MRLRYKFIKACIVLIFIIFASIDMAISQPKLELNLLASKEKFNLNLLDTMVNATAKSPGFIVIRITKGSSLLGFSDTSKDSFALLIGTITLNQLDDFSYTFKHSSRGCFEYKNNIVLIHGDRESIEYFFSKTNSIKEIALSKAPEYHDPPLFTSNDVIYIFSKGSFMPYRPK